MKIPMVGVVAVVVCGLAVAGCKPKSESEATGTAGFGERTGIALDNAAEKTAEVTSNAVDKTVDAAKATGTATKEVAGKVVEKTGEVLEKAGSAVERAGENMQD